MTRSTQRPEGGITAAPTRTVEAAGARFVYREVGAVGSGAQPLVALTHLGANLDGWDPELVDPLADGRHVILIGYRGVGGSTGAVRQEIDDMAADAIAVIRALGYERVDLFGLSMGGMVAQSVIEQAPDLIDRVVLAGSGPRSGPALEQLRAVMLRGIARGVLTASNPTSGLFFTRTRNGTRAAKAYQARLKRRRDGRDAAVTPTVFRAQLRAVTRWAHALPARPAESVRPVLILHGDSDRLVPVTNADALLARYPQAELHLYPDSGHGVVFQYRRQIADTVTRFLRR